MERICIHESTQGRVLFQDLAGRRGSTIEPWRTLPSMEYSGKGCLQRRQKEMNQRSHKKEWNKTAWVTEAGKGWHVQGVSILYPLLYLVLTQSERSYYSPLAMSIFWAKFQEELSKLGNIPSCKELTHWKRHWCWEGLGAGGEGDDRGWDGWMASPTRWTWVWVNSRSWWWTGRPGVLRFMGLQRVGHDWVTELNWRERWDLSWHLSLSKAKYSLLYTKSPPCPARNISWMYMKSLFERDQSVLFFNLCAIQFSSVQLLSRVQLFVTP